MKQSFPDISTLARQKNTSLTADFLAFPSANFSTDFAIKFEILPDADLRLQIVIIKGRKVAQFFQKNMHVAQKL